MTSAASSFAALWIVLLSLSTLSARPAFDQERFRVVGYYSMKAAMESPKVSNLRYLTHINLWFLNPDSTGSFPQDLSALKPFVDGAHKRGVKVLFSIGGGSKQAQYHRLLGDEHRSRLVNNFVEQVMRYNLDGIDVDLEGSDIHETYEAFVVELADALHARRKLITSAVAIYYKDKYTDKVLSQYDFMNVMSYDRTGPWRPDRPGPHSLYVHAEEDLAYFTVNRKIPASRLTLGVPFYGYGFGPDRTSQPLSMRYNQIIATYKGTEHADQWTLPDGKILYYNGMPTISLKTRLARAKASGVMIWELRGDAKGRQSLVRAIHRAASGR